MGELVAYKLSKDDVVKHLTKTSFEKQYILYDDIFDETRISKEEVDSVRSNYFGLFTAVYDTLGNNLVGKAIEKSKLGDFIHYDLDSIVKAFGINEDWAHEMIEILICLKQKLIQVLL